MTPSADYALTETAGTLVIEWATATLPLEIKVLAVIFLCVAQFLYFFRN